MSSSLITLRRPDLSKPQHFLLLVCFAFVLMSTLVGLVGVPLFLICGAPRMLLTSPLVVLFYGALTGLLLHYRQNLEKPSLAIPIHDIGRVESVPGRVKLILEDGESLSAYWSVYDLTDLRAQLNRSVCCELTARTVDKIRAGRSLTIHHTSKKISIVCMAFAVLLAPWNPLFSMVYGMFAVFMVMRAAFSKYVTEVNHRGCRLDNGDELRWEQLNSITVDVAITLHFEIGNVMLTQGPQPISWLSVRVIEKLSGAPITVKTFGRFPSQKQDLRFIARR